MIQHLKILPIPKLTVHFINSNNQQQIILFSFKLSILITSGQPYPITNLPLSLYLTLKSIL